VKDGVGRVSLREYVLVLPVFGNRPSFADLGQKDMGIERQLCFRNHRRPLSEAGVRQERIIFWIPVFGYWEETRGSDPAVSISACRLTCPLQPVQTRCYAGRQREARAYITPGKLRE